MVAIFVIEFTAGGIAFYYRSQASFKKFYLFWKFFDTNLFIAKWESKKWHEWVNIGAIQAARFWGEIKVVWWTATTSNWIKKNKLINFHFITLKKFKLKSSNAADRKVLWIGKTASLCNSPKVSITNRTTKWPSPAARLHRIYARSGITRPT